MVEGEIAFVMNRDFKNGAESIKEVKEGIDYIMNAVEFAQDFAIPEHGDPGLKTLNHTIAAGMGHVGVVLGSGRTDLKDINLEEETVKCYVDGELVTQGKGSNIYGGPLNALYSLINMLPENGSFVKKGDVILTGSVYENPLIDSTATIKVDYSTLGSIDFDIEK